MKRLSRAGGAASLGAAIVLVALTGCAPATTIDYPVATFEVAGVETYKIALGNAELIEHAQRLLDGDDIAAIPIGKVVRDSPSVNKPWSWHIDPDTLEFAEVTIEVCDGLPSFVENNEVTSDYYCPWIAKIISID